MTKAELVRNIDTLPASNKDELIRKLSDLSNVGTRIIREKLANGELTQEELKVVNDYLIDYKENWLMFET